MASRTARDIRDAIGGRGRYSAVRSWDCVCLLRLDDTSLEILAWLAERGVADGLTTRVIAGQLPPWISARQLMLYLGQFHPERIKRPQAVPTAPARLTQVEWIMREQHVSRRQAHAFAVDPARAERRRA